MPIVFGLHEPKMNIKVGTKMLGDKDGDSWVHVSQTLHVCHICLHWPLWQHPNVGKYTSPMECLGSEMFPLTVRLLNLHWPPGHQGPGHLPGGADKKGREFDPVLAGTMDVVVCYGTVNKFSRHWTADVESMFKKQKKQWNTISSSESELVISAATVLCMCNGHIYLPLSGWTIDCKTPPCKSQWHFHYHGQIPAVINVSYELL